ncbi:S1 RNA-binding domain-containing protein [Streptomyces sp. NPDC059193]|uniref:S1 RNA-binding domain-containing protein n=1 Tax=Streptomyces sp. NPDC059193 TaxID=3346763 RepID=UPI003690C9DE
MPPFVYRITEYEPEDRDRDRHGSHTAAEDTTSDHGPVEAAYLQAIAAFAEDTGVNRLAVREPGVGRHAHSGLEPAIDDGYGLAGLFPPDLSGFHDGAEVTLSVGLELVRVMLRDNGARCCLEAAGGFTVRVGWDQYVYVTSEKPCQGALARTRALGLFPERLERSPYDADDADDADGEDGEDGEDQGVQRPADGDFWDRLRWSVAMRKAAVLEEEYVDGASRRHRLTEDTLDEVRARITPRARLTVWPDPSTEEPDPLFTAVLPDSDGVLRARWRTEPTQSDRDWAFLRTIRPGEICTGTVTEIADFGVTFVDIGGFTAMINLPELSWRPFDHPSDIVTVGQRISAEILDVDMKSERVPLSLKALQHDPMPAFVQQIGQVTTGVVTRLVPFGACVRIEDRADGLEGFVHLTELAEGDTHRPEDVTRVGATLAVKIMDVDPSRRRIGLSHLKALTPRQR